MTEVEATNLNSNSGSSSKLSFWAIVIIAANTMNGPGLTTLPAIAQSAGHMAYAILVVAAMCVTSYVNKRLCMLIWGQKLHRYSPALEESDIVALSGKAWKNNSSQSRRIASIAMVGCALALALAQMMLCAKIADAMIVASFGSSCGVSPFPTNQMLYCTSNLSMKPFAPAEATSIEEIEQADGSEFIYPGDLESQMQSSLVVPPMCLITAGLIIASTITISLASVDQSSMLTAQYVLFGCLLLACMRFYGTLQYSVDENCEEHPNPILGDRPFDAVGPVLFNFAFVVTAPRLSCGAPDMNSAIRALTVSTGIMGSLYIIIGWAGAPSAACYGDDSNLLSLVLRGRGALDILSVIVFGLSQLAAIPVYCELARETMDSHIPLVSPKAAFWLCHGTPWVICAVTYNSELFESFVEWSSLILLGFCNFSLPLLLDLMLKEHGVILSNGRHQRTQIGQGPDTVLWIYSLVSASLAAVIVQRMTESVLFAEVAFMATVLMVFYYY